MQTPIESVLAWLREREAFTVVQVGAYVGNSGNDPLYGFLLEARPGARALLVEPVAEYFEALERAYAGVPGVRLERVAIAEEEGERDFFRLGVDPREHGQPEWLAQLGSLKESRMTEMWDGYERGVLSEMGVQEDLKGFWHAHRIRETVSCTTLPRLLERHGIQAVDLLQIDAEGYDFEILKTIDFARLRPRFINYERVLLQDDEPACRKMLADAGYVLFDWGQDTLCVGVG